MITYRSYDRNKAFHSYYVADGSNKEKSKIQSSNIKRHSDGLNQRKIRPYLPMQNSQRSTISTDDDMTTASFASLKSKRSLSGMSADMFDSRRHLSPKAERALFFDNISSASSRFGGGGGGGGVGGFSGGLSGEGGMLELERSPSLGRNLNNVSACGMYYSPSFGKSPPQRRQNHNYKFPSFVPDSDDEHEDEDGWGFIDPLVQIYVKKQKERKRQLEEELKVIRELAKKFREKEDTEDKRARRKKRLETLGRNASMFFFPLSSGLDEWSDEDVSHSECVSVCSSDNCSTEDEEDDEDQGMPAVEIVKEPDEDEYPFLLNHSMMQQISDHGLPMGIAMRKWKRLYCLSRDGDSINTMLYLVERYRYTLLVIKTTNGHIFGAYCNDRWEDKGGNTTKSFYGSGQTFLFSVQQVGRNVHSTSRNDDNDKDGPPVVALDDVKEDEPTSEEAAQQDLGHVDIYKWRGTNSYFQMCDVSIDRLAFGGGSGSFGLCIENSFTKGSTGYCDTFGNPPLCNDHHFEIVNVEVYAFVTSGYHVD